MSVDQRDVDTVRGRVDDPASPHYRAWFDPTSVVLRPELSPGVVSGPTVAEVMGDDAVEADASMFEIADNDAFVAGGYQRGAIWADTSQLPDLDVYLASLDPDDLAEVMHDQAHGVDVVRELDAEFVESVRATDPAARKLRRHRKIDVRNAPKLVSRGCTREEDGQKCRCFICFMLYTILTMLASGAARCVGTIADVEAGGDVPWVLASLTIEPNKPRFCYNSRALNEATRERPTSLEGLDVTRGYVSGESTLGAVLDEKSGYYHHLLSKDSEGFMGFVFMNWVYVYRTLPFGWKLGAFIHQRAGMVCTGYYRFLGGRCSQYLDDRTLVARRGYERCQVDFQRQVYVLLVLMWWFGYTASLSKSVLEGRYDFRTLGLVCDSKLQSFLVGNARYGFDKRDEYIALGRSLAAAARDELRISWVSASRFAGKSIAWSKAIPFMRHVLNINYAVIHQRAVRWGRDTIDAGELLPISAREGDDVTLKPGPALSSYIREVLTCVHLVSSERVWPFLCERHACILLVEQDARLIQGGVYLELTAEAKAAGVQSPWGTKYNQAFGNLLPEVVEGYRITHGVTSGIGEIAGLWLTLAAIDNDPDLRRHFQGVIIRIWMDNFEVVQSYRKGAVSGEGTLVKSAVLLSILHFAWSWDSVFELAHVPGKCNVLLYVLLLAFAHSTLLFCR